MCGRITQTRSISEYGAAVGWSEEEMRERDISGFRATFAKGASLQDPASLFNSSLDGKVRRAIDIHEGVEIDAVAFKALIREAITLNSAGKLAAKSKSVKKAKV